MDRETKEKLIQILDLVKRLAMESVVSAGDSPDHLLDIVHDVNGLQQELR